MLALVPVEITERGTRVEARTRYPSGDDRRRTGRRNLNVSVAFTVAAPEGTRILVKSISGNISVRDILGGLTLESVSGAIRIANAGRMVNGRSISGDIELNDTKVEGALEAGTISGTVRLRRLTARSLTVNSVSGSVVMEDVTAERVGAQSISGDITYGGDLQPNGNYELTSHSGNVRLALAGLHRLSARGHLLQRVDQHRYPGHDVGRAKWPPQPRVARHRRRRRGLPRPHHLLGLNHHRQTLAGGPRSRGSHDMPLLEFPTVTSAAGDTAWRKSSANPGNHQGRAAGGAGTLVAQVP